MSAGHIARVSGWRPHLDHPDPAGRARRDGHGAGHRGAPSPGARVERRPGPCEAAQRRRRPALGPTAGGQRAAACSADRQHPGRLVLPTGTDADPAAGPGHPAHRRQSVYRMAAVDQSNGTIRPLDHQPPLRWLQASTSPADYGIWTSGYDPTTRRPAVVPRHGRTWQTTALPDAPVPNTLDAFPGSPPVIDTADGQTVYATVLVHNETDAYLVFCSLDGGRTWQKADPTNQITAGVDTSIALPDNRHLAIWTGVTDSGPSCATSPPPARDVPQHHDPTGPMARRGDLDPANAGRRLLHQRRRRRIPVRRRPRLAPGLALGIAGSGSVARP